MLKFGCLQIGQEKAVRISIIAIDISIPDWISASANGGNSK